MFRLAFSYRAEAGARGNAAKCHFSETDRSTMHDSGNKMEQLPVIADYGDLCGETPLWDESSGTLYWTDCAGLKFYRYSPATGKHEVVKRGLEVNGAALNQPG